MLYCFRERELLLNINEADCRLPDVPELIRIGGLREDLPRLPPSSPRAARSDAEEAGARCEDLLTGQPDLHATAHRRASAVPRSSSATSTDGLVAADGGPGSTYDVRKAYPYSGYETFDLDVPDLAGRRRPDRYRRAAGEMQLEHQIC